TPLAALDNRVHEALIAPRLYGGNVPDAVVTPARTPGGSLPGDCVVAASESKRPGFHGISAGDYDRLVLCRGSGRGGHGRSGCSGRSLRVGRCCERRLHTGLDGRLQV